MKVQVHQDGMFYQEWLSKKYGDKVKGQLTTAMQQDGYDGVYVEDSGEITVFDPDNFVIDRKKSEQSLQAYQEWKGAAGKSFKEWLARCEAGGT